MVNSQDDYYHLPDYAEIDAKQGDEESLRLRTNSSPSSLRSAYPEPAICRCCPCDMYNYVVLTLICSLTFGSYWVFDTPGAIETGLKEWFGPSYTSKMNLDLYSVYSWPNTVLAFFGGYIIDKVTGIRMGTTLFCGLIFIGQIVFLLGINMKAYWICLLGRFIFGLGGESLTVAQNTFTLRWFEGPQLALAFGLVVSFSRVGSAVNFIVTPWMSSHFTVPASVGFGTLMCFFSFVSCLVLYVMDYYGEPRLEAKKAAAAVAAGTDSAPASPRLGQSDDDSDMEGWAQAGGQAGSSMTAWEKAVTAVTFPSSAWMLFVITMFFYIGVLTFNTIASSIMQHTGTVHLQARGSISAHREKKEKKRNMVDPEKNLSFNLHARTCQV